MLGSRAVWREGACRGAPLDVSRSPAALRPGYSGADALQRSKRPGALAVVLRHTQKTAAGCVCGGTNTTRTRPKLPVFFQRPVLHLNRAAATRADKRSRPKHYHTNTGTECAEFLCATLTETTVVSYSSTLPPAPPAPAFFFTPTMRAPSHRYRRLEAVSGRSLPSVDSVVGHRKTDRCAGARTPAVRPGAGVRAGWTGWAAPKKSARAPTAHVVENRPGGHRPNGFHYGVFSLRWHLGVGR